MVIGGVFVGNVFDVCYWWCNICELVCFGDGIVYLIE